MTQIDPRIRVCGVCATVLDHIGDATPQHPDRAERRTANGFAHTWGAVAAGHDDHPPVPVEPGEVFAAAFCDFCYAPDPDHVLPARPFVYVDGENASLDDWGICDTCANLVERNRWNVILRRVGDGHFALYGEKLTRVQLDMIRRNHARLRVNITGAPRPGHYPSPDDRKDRR